MEHDLQRFLDAQENDYPKALGEIRNGRKCSHWIWYIFPQLKELGYSYNARYYGIDGIKEAREYVKNPVLKDRLHEITRELLKLESRNPSEIMGYPDDMKLLSCMTLFEAAEEDCGLYAEVINVFFNGKRDEKTLELLKNDNNW